MYTKNEQQNGAVILKLQLYVMKEKNILESGKIQMIVNKFQAFHKHNCQKNNE